jgi:hypothetical protein
MPFGRSEKTGLSVPGMATGSVRAVAGAGQKGANATAAMQENNPDKVPGELPGNGLKTMELATRPYRRAASPPKLGGRLPPKTDW